LTVCFQVERRSRCRSLDHVRLAQQTRPPLSEAQAIQDVVNKADGEI
jgi:hypothetical protein